MWMRTLLLYSTYIKFLHGRLNTTRLTIVPAGNIPIKMLVFMAFLAIHACIAGTIPATPENITVTFLTPTSVRVAWQTMLDLQTHPIEKYLVTYKPTDDSYRVVQQVAGNSEAVVLDRLSPSTQYSITVTAIWGGNKYRSRQVIFRTLDLPRAQQDTYPVASGLPMAPHGSGSNSNSGSSNNNNNHGVGFFTDEAVSATSSNSTNSTTRELPPIRGVEVGIVLLVLMVWAGAIALFFNRWGKIRMLLPYQPDYKQEQLKVPGTGVCAGSTCNGQHSHQHFHFIQDEPSTTISERCTRSRINSAIFVSSEGKGFDSIEFLRRHGSQSVLCRKAKSAENISDEERKRRFSENRQWGTEDSNNPSETIELAECHVMPASTAAAIASTSTGGGPPIVATTTHSATVTTANAIVGSISIETPPPHIQQEQRREQFQKQHSQGSQEHKTPKLQRQKSSSSTNYSQSPSVSRSGSPVLLNLKSSKPKLTNLPTLSVSGPSPPHEGEFL